MPIVVRKVTAKLKCSDHKKAVSSLTMMAEEERREGDGREAPVTAAVDSSMGMCTRYVTVCVLFFVNLLNYMDRYTIAGVLDKVENFYTIQNGEAGILQAVFIIGYMVFSPIFGYCGDRFNRKNLMIGGIFFWSGITLASSFVPPGYFWLLVLLRGLVGIGEASYSTIAPTILSDMFVGTKRSVALMVFYFAIPVGSGLGYIVGSSVANLAGPGHWYWALRVTPGLGVICCALIFFVAKEPPRGMAEHSSLTHSTSLWRDLRALIANKSFMLNVFGFVCVAFVAGALALFAPSFVYKGYLVQGLHTSEASVSFDFGLLTCGAGFFGIFCGASLAHFVKKRHPSGDAIVCAIGLISSSILLFLSLLCLQYTVALSWVLMFTGMTMVCMNWSLSADILLYTVVPTRRSTAEAMMNFVGHLLGDAGSPYLVGEMSDALANHTKLSDFTSMQYSLFTCPIVAMLGGILYVVAIFYIPGDRARADAITKGIVEESSDAGDLEADVTSSDVTPLVDPR